MLFDKEHIVQTGDFTFRVPVYDIPETIEEQEVLCDYINREFSKSFYNGLAESILHGIDDSHNVNKPFIIDSKYYELLHKLSKKLTEFEHRRGLYGGIDYEKTS